MPNTQIELSRLLTFSEAVRMYGEGNIKSTHVEAEVFFPGLLGRQDLDWIAERFDGVRSVRPFDRFDDNGNLFCEQGCVATVWKFGWKAA
jgi:hypothetical protein